MSSRATVRAVNPPASARKPASEPERQAEDSLAKKPGRVWRDHLIMLLHIAAATEHALMVQYLYAAYSLDLEQEEEKRRKMVERWQKSILAIAKEEMGHLLTVQNILTLIGGPINLEREDFPWDAPYYPFPFRLEPLTMDSLACYVFAEMPGNDKFSEPGKDVPARFREFHNKEENEIKRRVTNAVLSTPRRDSTERDRLYRMFIDEVIGDESDDPKRRELAIRKIVKAAEQAWSDWQGRASGHRVGELYDNIMELIQDPERIPDSAFQGATFSLQASWEDWGRGYQPDPRMLGPRGDVIDDQPKRNGEDKHELPPPSAREAHVMIEQVATRTEAVEALRRIAGQGEAPHLEADETGEPSHFDRFLEIYDEFEGIRSWKPSHNVAVNPSTRHPVDGGAGAYIENEHTRYWADLFNLRYRMLLTYLAHTFRLARVSRADEPSVRAVVMHKAFGEMYNLKTIAGMLVRLPLGEKTGDGATRAGPPFEIPYSLRLPHGPDAWRLHRDLLTAAAQLCDALHPDSEKGSRRYLFLQTLKDLDRQSVVWIDRVLAGVGSTERQRV